MFDVSREDITDGPLSRVLLVLAAPLVAQNFALVAQSVIDLFWVGRLGGDAVAAVGLSTVVVGLLMVPVIAFTVGTQIVTSQRVGADAIANARRVPVVATAMAVGVAAVLGIVLVVFAPTLVSLFGVTGQAATFAVAYLTAYSLALIATAGSDTLEAGFTGWGETRAALYVNLTAIVVNLVFDPLLILGIGPFPDWGVFGAAIATAIGYGVGAVFALLLALRGRHGFSLTRDAIAFDVDTAREVVTVGVPVAVQNSGRQVARLVMIGIVTVVGGAAGLAAYHIGSRVAAIAFVPAQGLSQAATSIVGQNLGADKPLRARKATWLAVAVAVVGLSVFGIAQWVYPKAIAWVFVPDLDGQALTYTVLYLQILAYGYWALGAIYTLQSGFNGSSNTSVSMYSTLIQYWAVRVPIAAAGAFVFDIGLAAVFWGVTLSNVAAAIGLGIYYYYSTNRGMLRRAAREAAAAAGD